MTSAILNDAKTRVAETVDRLADELEQISHRIHANPELCFEEPVSYTHLTLPTICSV